MKRFEPGVPPPPVRHGFIMKRLSRELDLTEIQRVEIEKIVRFSEKSVSSILPDQDSRFDRIFCDVAWIYLNVSSHN